MKVKGYMYPQMKKPVGMLSVFPLTLPKLIFNDYRYLKFLFAIFGVLAETQVFFPWSNQRSPHVFFCLVWLMF